MKIPTVRPTIKNETMFTCSRYSGSRKR